MFTYTDTKRSPWFVVNADNKKRARLNCISHLLSSIHYEEIDFGIKKLPPREKSKGYVRSPKDIQTFVPEVY